VIGTLESTREIGHPFFASSAIVWNCSAAHSRCDPSFTNVIDLEGAADERWDEQWIVASNGSGESSVELLSDNPRPWGGRQLAIVPSAHCEAGTAQLDSPPSTPARP